MKELKFLTQGIDGEDPTLITQSAFATVTVEATPKPRNPERETREREREREREKKRVLFFGTQFSILYTFMYSPA